MHAFPWEGAAYGWGWWWRRADVLNLIYVRMLMTGVLLHHHPRLWEWEKKKNRKYSITRPPPREDETFLAVLKRCHAWRGRRHQRKKKWEAKIQDEGVWVMARKFPYSSNKTTLRKGAAAATEGHEICTKTCASFFLKTGRKLAVCERCFFWENASGKMAVLILGV